MADQNGDRFIDKYKVIKKIGEGGMGKVLLCLHPEFGENMVLKQLNLKGDDEYKKRFMQEALLMKNFRHENIVSVQDYIIARRQHYMVMEYIDGLPLDEMIKGLAARGEHLPVKESVYIFREVARALEYIHSKEVIHRDIKPANVLISNEGSVKLTDFGIAQAGNQGDIFTGTNVVGAPDKTQAVTFGTPSYMPPEQFQDAGKVTQSSDVYAMGVMFYELLTSKRPFGDNFSPSVMKNINKGKYPSPRFWNKSIPLSLSFMIRKAMKAAPASRYATIKALRIKLDKYLSKHSDADMKGRLVTLVDSIKNPAPVTAEQTIVGGGIPSGESEATIIGGGANVTSVENQPMIINDQGSSLNLKKLLISIVGVLFLLAATAGIWLGVANVKSHGLLSWFQASDYGPLCIEVMVAPDGIRYEAEDFSVLIYSKVGSLDEDAGQYRVAGRLIDRAEAEELFMLEHNVLYNREPLPMPVRFRKTETSENGALFSTGTLYLKKGGYKVFLDGESEAGLSYLYVHPRKKLAEDAGERKTKVPKVAYNFNLPTSLRDKLPLVFITDVSDGLTGETVKFVFKDGREKAPVRVLNFNGEEGNRNFIDTIMEKEAFYLKNLKQTISYYSSEAYYERQFDLTIKPWRQVFHFSGTMQPVGVRVKITSNLDDLQILIDGEEQYIRWDEGQLEQKLDPVNSGDEMILYLIPGEHELTAKHKSGGFLTTKNVISRYILNQEGNVVINDFSLTINFDEVNKSLTWVEDTEK